METRIDHIAGGIHRISTWVPAFGITFNQFLIVDERPALIHTGEYGFYDNVRKAVAQVIDPSTLAYVALLHWEGDENGGMDRFMPGAPKPSSSALRFRFSSTRADSASPIGCAGSRTDRRCRSAAHTLRFLETPHVHHWDSMMVVEESTKSLFPSDLFLQPGDQPPVVTEDLSDPMCEVYRKSGSSRTRPPSGASWIASPRSILDWIHAMHGGTLTRQALPSYIAALRATGIRLPRPLLGRQVEAATTTSPTKAID